MKSILVFGLLLSFSTIFSTVFLTSASANGIFPTRSTINSTINSAIKKALKNQLNSVNTFQAQPQDTNVLYFGGPVISNVQVVVVFWGRNVDKDVQSKIGNFYQAVTNSSYLDWLEEYNTKIFATDGRRGTEQDVGRGILADTVTITPIDTRVQLDKVDVQVELEKQISQHVLPRPNANTLYMIYYPPGITLTTGGIASCQAWCGDHEGFTSQGFGNIYYAMMPDFGGVCKFSCGSFGATTMDAMTIVSSHELVESITDPMCPNINAVSAYPAAWVSSAEEIGDLCVNSSALLKAGAITYTLQGEWDKDNKVCKRGTFTNP